MFLTGKVEVDMQMQPQDAEAAKYCFRQRNIIWPDFHKFINLHVHVVQTLDTAGNREAGNL